PLGLDSHQADFNFFTDDCFEDLDFEMLFDPAYDGTMHAEIAAAMGYANLDFAAWCRPFFQRAIHPYLWPDAPVVWTLPRLIAPSQTSDRLPPASVAQLHGALGWLPESEMTTGAAAQCKLSPRERAALHLAAVQVLEQCLNDLTAAERHLQQGWEALLAQ